MQHAVYSQAPPWRARVPGTHKTHRRERGLAVVNVPNGTDVNVRLVAVEGRKPGGRSWQSWFRGADARGAQGAAVLEGPSAL